MQRSASESCGRIGGAIAGTSGRCGGIGGGCCGGTGGGGIGGIGGIGGAAADWWWLHTLSLTLSSQSLQQSEKEQVCDKKSTSSKLSVHLFVSTFLG